MYLKWSRQPAGKPTRQQEAAKARPAPANMVGFFAPLTQEPYLRGTSTMAIESAAESKRWLVGWL